jgi:hypothetical protein
MVAEQLLQHSSSQLFFRRTTGVKSNHPCKHEQHRKHRSSINDAASKMVHQSLPELVWMSRLTYVAFAIFCYVLIFGTFRDIGVVTTTDPITNNIIRNRSNIYNENTVAFAVVITSCGGHKDTTFEIVEGASVLRYSIHQNSMRGTNGGKYDYQLYALYHPDAVVCASTLTELGFIVQPHDTPVRVEDIQTDLLRERIVSNGCCGEKELIKLAAFTLIQHPLVVLLDIDVLILQPLDRLFDFMLNTKQLPRADDFLYVNKPALVGRNTNVTIPQHVDLLYTTDYAMVNPERKIKPTQGGFVILRPNQTVYDDFVSIVKEGDFRFDGPSDLGWGGRTGRFWGGTYFHSREWTFLVASKDPHIPITHSEQR